jgi:hypothetical protein
LGGTRWKLQELTHVSRFLAYVTAVTSDFDAAIESQDGQSTREDNLIHDPILAAAYGCFVMKAHCKRYSVRELLSVLKKVKKMIENDNTSMCIAAGSINASPS